MPNTNQDPTAQVSVLQQLLSGGKKPIGLFLGAGCPLAVSTNNKAPLIPDIAGITEIVHQQLSNLHGQKDLFKAAHGQLMSDGKQDPTVEDLLTHIRALAAVAGSEPVRGLSGDELDKLDSAICDLIYQVVHKELPDRTTPYHSVATWANAIPREFPIEIFTTNYDLLMEQAMEESRVPYFDGFPGARKPLFDPFAIEQDAPLPSWTRLWKLHGSINWYQDQDLQVYRGTASETDRRRVIHPSHLKYRESRRMPYLAMLDRMRSFLRVSTAAMVTCGYSFRDEHINETILQGLQHTQTNVVFALMHGRVEQCTEATELAEQLPNLNVLACDGGVISGRRAEWVTQAEEAILDSDDGAVTWTAVVPNDPDVKLKAQFNLGDFAVFGDFLRVLAGEGHRQWGELNSAE